MESLDIEKILTLPADQAVQQLAGVNEDQWCEKKSGRIKAADLAPVLVGMANAEGGIVVVGVHDKRLDPVLPDNENELRQASVDFTRPPVRVRIEQVPASAGKVLIFRVAPGEQVHETGKGECYQRMGDETRKLSFPQRQELEWDKGAVNFSGTVVKGVGVPDLDQQQLEHFAATLGSSSAKKALYARDLLSGTGAVTIAAYLLFARRPQMRLPSAYIRVLKYVSNERGQGADLQVEAGKDARCEGSLPQQVSQAAQLIEQFLPKRQALQELGKFGATAIIPRDAWMEGLVNAVVHRSYSNSGDHIRVEIFPNRIEISNPGRFLGLSDPTRPETIVRHARNPRIARVFNDLGFTQELGEGIRRMFQQMRRFGLNDPIYVQTGEGVRLSLMASSALPTKALEELGVNGQRVFQALMKAGRPLGTGQVVELVQMARPTVLRYLKQLQAAGIVVREGRSPTDPRATWQVL